MKKAHFAQSYQILSSLINFPLIVVFVQIIARTFTYLLDHQKLLKKILNFKLIDSKRTNIVIFELYQDFKFILQYSYITFKLKKIKFSDQLVIYRQFWKIFQYQYQKYLMSQVTLGYWKIRGLGQHLRLLLAYTGLEFKDVQYETPEKWFGEDKPNLGFDFPNLPYLIDGEFKLTESSAIAKYIINKSGKTDLLGKNTQDQGHINNILGVLNDGLKDIRGLFWNKDYQAIKVQTLEKARPKFNFLKEFIGDKQFALGYLTLVDFHLAQNLAYFQALYPSQHKHYAFWWRIRHNFEQLPEIKAYYKRADAVHGPYLPPQKASLLPGAKKVKLGYWGIRGKAHSVRLLLSFAGVQFEDKIYTESDKWFKEDKLHLGLDFPNLPYLIDGEYNISQASAIQRYVIRKWGNKELLGKNAHDNAQIESILSIFEEAAGAVRGLFFNKDHETAKTEVIQKYKPKLELLNKFIGEKNFALGYLTLADFIIAEDSYYIERVFPEEFKAFPFLHRIRENFQNLPETKAYYSSEKAFKGRFFPAYAFMSVEKE